MDTAGRVILVAFSPDGRVLASITDKERVVKLWSVASGDELNSLKILSSWMGIVEFAPDSRTLAAGFLDGG